MNILKFTRYGEWWEYKLIPLLTVGYASIIVYGLPLVDSIQRLILVMLAIIFGAIYVSVINDITDLKEDRIASKKNTMMNMSRSAQFLILASCISTGLLFGYLLFYPDWLSLICYLMAYVVFTLYSTPPFRLKNRGIFGVFCDALGAHFFPTLVVSSSLAYLFNIQQPILWVIPLAGWAFFYGLRGILWHQFQDRDNDLKSGTTTYASKVNPLNFGIQEKLIFFAETICLILFLSMLKTFLLWTSLAMYLCLVLIRKYSFKYQTSLIITPKIKPYQILFNDLYLVFLPLSLLTYLSVNQTHGWTLLLGHLVLFPFRIYAVTKDIFIFVKYSLIRL